LSNLHFVGGKDGIPTFFLTLVGIVFLFIEVGGRPGLVSHAGSSQGMWYLYGACNK